VAHVVRAVGNYGETKYDRLRLRAITAQREALHRLRAHGEIQEELDWAELDAAPAGSFQSLAN
jgi:CPA1 family monovalent cation:H+ antiporter